MQEVKKEKGKRERALQVQTARRVVERYFVKKERHDAESQTDVDEISFMRNYYEN